MGIFNEIESIEDNLSNVRNPELANGQQVWNEIVNSMFNTCKGF